MRKPTKDEARAIAALRGSDRPLTHAELMVKARVADGVAREALGLLHDDGVLEMESRGDAGYSGLRIRSGYEIVYSVRKEA